MSVHKALEIGVCVYTHKYLILGEELTVFISNSDL